MTDRELFIECVSRLSNRGIAIKGNTVCVHVGTAKEREAFNFEGYNIGYNLYRLGQVLAYDADFN